jgi:uncharacterized SAM-binding protein YcdF (DUF218 family)
MPMTMFWIILLTGILVYSIKRKRTGISLVLISVLWLALITTPFFPRLLASSLENQYHSCFELPEFPPKDTINILVLGGGHMENVNLPPNDQLSYSSVCRLLEGIRLHRLTPGSRMVFSGRSKDRKYSHAEVMKRSALSMGVEEKDIFLLPYSVNTKEEAIDYTKKFGAKNILVLVTDAIHMPRAMYLFQKAGQSPIPAPTNHLVKSVLKNGTYKWGSSSENMAMMEYALHELVGIAWEKSRFRSSGHEVKNIK